jgi:hypothetical protein
MKYRLEDGHNVCIKIELQLSKIGLHAAIGGSLAYRGDSNKDIDIILYPHNRKVLVDQYQVADLLAENGYKAVRFDAEPSTCVPDVLPTEDAKGRRVDFFFMQRSDWFTGKGGAA